MVLMGMRRKSRREWLWRGTKRTGRTGRRIKRGLGGNKFRSWQLIYCKWGQEWCWCFKQGEENLKTIEQNNMVTYATPGQMLGLLEFRALIFTQIFAYTYHMLLSTTTGIKAFLGSHSYLDHPSAVSSCVFAEGLSRINNKHRRKDGEAASAVVKQSINHPRFFVVFRCPWSIYPRMSVG